MTSSDREVLQDPLADDHALAGACLPLPQDCDHVLLEVVPMPIAIARADRRVIACNRAWRRAFGLRQGAQPQDAFIRLSPRERERILAEWAIAAAVHRAYTGVVHLRSDPRAQERRHRLHAHLQQSGQDACWILYADDAEDLIEEIDFYRTQAQQLNAFAALTAHDLQEPLRAILGFLELLQRRHARDLPPTGQEFIQRSLDGARRMRTLISRMLATARQGRPEEQLQQVRLTDIVAQVLRDLQPEIEAQQATIQVHDLPVIAAFPSECVQIYLNLIGNALRYRAERPLRIACGARRIEHAWELFVSDNGIGMPEAQCKRLFDRYEPGDSRAGGMGIGLRTCRRLIEAHGNRLWVSSTVGAGSTFTWSWQDAMAPVATPDIPAVPTSVLRTTSAGTDPPA